eukprot:766653-Hanusia_phi.AAC.2
MPSPSQRSKRKRSVPSEASTAKDIRVQDSSRNKTTNKQDDILRAIGDQPVTERQILSAVGDNRYTREILRRLMALSVVERMGKGGSSEPFLYKVVRSPSEALREGRKDPVVEVRLKRVEDKIISFFKLNRELVTEKAIRSCIGDNTGTGKALRRLVSTRRILRIGKGGAGSPFLYRLISSSSDDDKTEEDVFEEEGSVEVLSKDQDMSDRSTVVSTCSSDLEEQEEGEAQRRGEGSENVDPSRFCFPDGEGDKEQLGKLFSSSDGSSDLEGLGDEQLDFDDGGMGFPACLQAKAIKIDSIVLPEMKAGGESTIDLIKEFLE